MPILTSNLINELSNQPVDAIDFYETAIASDESIIDNYWRLGVAYLLVGREDDAQAAWFIPLASATEDEVNDLTIDLIRVLEESASEQFEISDLQQVWLLRQHILFLAPDHIENICHLICVANLIGTLTPDLLVEWQAPELLQYTSLETFDADLLESVIGSLINIWDDLGLEIISACLQAIKSGRELIIKKLLCASQQMIGRPGSGLFRVRLVEICNRIEPNIIETVQVLTYLYSDLGLYAEAMATVEQYYELASDNIDQLFGSFIELRIRLHAGDWQGTTRIRIDRHRQLLTEIIQLSPQNLLEAQCKKLLISSFLLPYTEDNPLVNKTLQNQIANIYQQNILNIHSDLKSKNSLLGKKKGCLRIGYIASTLKKHSVGWLSRWLIHHHDRQSFQIFLYCPNMNEADNFNHHWFRDKVDSTAYFGLYNEEIVAQIRADEIDILIDLDSMTLDVTCLVMAEKPAPVQASWLGWDSPGIPAIDYFIADPYVLPDTAQDYYQERIWRLPQTYLAVDGFEIGIPTLNREDLDIPADAIVYLSSQSGLKRHPDCIRAQLQIIKAVPNSYFLIKGTSDATVIQNFFGKLSAEVGVSLDRLRFLDQVADEITHRANLAIADIVLDTFPYNGATTTLETLWMGIPMVTQVGQQFAARNSYTFMINAGIEEGIAWSAEEYIEWGIRLGLDRELRDKIAGKLRSGRTTAPVWNAKQFTLEMEQAYREMWAKYQAESQQKVVNDYSNN
jgi:predicted O-linked N-acetylglucosamine transferase (SPINDLY family)